MNYELEPGDTATVAQKDGETLTIRAYEDFTMLQAGSCGTALSIDSDEDFIAAVKVVEREEKESTKRKSVRVRANDEVVEFLRSRFPHRVGNARIMDFSGIAVLGVMLDIDGLTHDVLIDAGMSYDESVHLLGK